MYYIMSGENSPGHFWL